MASVTSKNIATAWWLCVILLLSLKPVVKAAEVDAETLRQIRELQQQNQQFMEQLRRQQALIEGLNKKVAELETQRDAPPPAPTPVPATAVSTTVPAREPEPKEEGAGVRFGNVHLSGEAGLAFFHTGPGGQFPNSEFRVDEAKLFLEAKVVEDVYFFTELNLFMRESDDEYLSLGELYADFENLSGGWGPPRLLNARIGRLDIPFGEEYLTRDAMDNPLISHSLSDVWGVDEGVEVYGEFKKFQYALAVQNGGHPCLRDYTADKSVCLRLGIDPAPWLHLSASAMRTGDLSVSGDKFSEAWFGNGFVRSLGSSNTTRFKAEMLEGDARIRLPHGHLAAAGGYLRYADNDPQANNRRDAFYCYLEGVQELNRKLYAAARFSRIWSERGLPLVGQGDFGRYFFGRDLTRDLWRLSFGVGYRFSRHVGVKLDYSLEDGRMVSGQRRNCENFFGTEVTVGF